jgi:hypothetical protein
MSKQFYSLGDMRNEKQPGLPYVLLCCTGSSVIYRNSVMSL